MGSESYRKRFDSLPAVHHVDRVGFDLIVSPIVTPLSIVLWGCTTRRQFRQLQKIRKTDWEHLMIFNGKIGARVTVTKLSDVKEVYSCHVK